MRARTPILLLVLVAAAVAAASTLQFDASRFRPRLQSAFEQSTGRTLALGRLSLRLLPSPSIVADDVSVANLPGGHQPMLSAVRLAATLDLLPLLHGDVRIASLTLTRPDIDLETVNGQPNWRFHPTRLPAASPAASTRQARTTFDLRALDVTGGHLVWRHAGRLGSGEATLDRATSQSTGAGLAVTATGHRRNAPFEISLSTVPIRQLLAGTGDIPLHATLTTGQANTDRLTLDGTLTPDGFDGGIGASLADLTDLDALFPHARLPNAAGIVVRARLTGTTGRWRVLALRASGRNADLSRLRPGLSLDRVSLDADNPQAPLIVHAAGRSDSTSFKFDGSAGSLDLWSNRDASAPVDLRVELAGEDTLAARGTLTHRAGLREIQARIVLDAPQTAALAAVLRRPVTRPFDVAGALDATRQGNTVRAKLDTTTLRIGSADFPPSHLTATLQPAQFLLQAAFAGAPWLTWRQDRTATPDATLDLDGNDLPASPVTDLLAGQPLLDGRLTLHAHLAGAVQETRLSRGTITGPFAATLLDGALQGPSSGIVADILHAARLPLPRNQAIDCAAVVGSARDGALILDHINLETSRLSVGGSGRIDPANRLDLDLQPVLHLGITDLATAVTVTGPADHLSASLAKTSGHVGLTIGRIPAAQSGCPAPKPLSRKPPKAADILRALGFH